MFNLWILLLSEIMRLRSVKNLLSTGEKDSSIK